MTGVQTCALPILIVRYGTEVSIISKTSYIDDDEIERLADIEMHDGI